MLHNIAEQCVRSAQRLVEFLHGEIRLQDFVAWWYNVSRRQLTALPDGDCPTYFEADLHSCGSTILIGRLCTFGEESGLDEPLSTAWDLCLQGLSRYAVVSSISRKSLCLLREYSWSILPNQGRQTVRPWIRISESRLVHDIF